MKIQTMSVVAGTLACNARCPFCVARMTPAGGVSVKPAPVNWRNFHKACDFAKDSGVSTVLITSKGEATLFPEQILEFMRALDEHKFPFIELQTNGIALAERTRAPEWLVEWHHYGLTTVAISIVHWESDRNMEIYRSGDTGYYQLSSLIRRIHDAGLSVRLTCMLLKDYIDNAWKVHRLIDKARDMGAEQLTIRTIDHPPAARGNGESAFVDRHAVDQTEMDNIESHLEKVGTKVLELSHGAKIYDVKGQNVCLTNCLTTHTDPERMRQLIFFPDGHLRYDWKYEGAILM